MYRTVIAVDTRGEGDIVDITGEVEKALRESRVVEGLVNLFVTGSTAALTTIEFEPGVLSDLKRSLAIIAPSNLSYAHDGKWGDGNGRSHVKAAIVGPSLTIPVGKGLLDCGTWQQIVLLELDTRPSRHRTITCTIMGEQGTGKTPKK
ncbi:MAG TPA: secondary thiamine-phosphate synthase enzyme YjbQ [Methanomicrobiales archaeon]|nr:secondary thiamine-phosphate synthase enzyme YjbQ [Methanomicrobiales archaeon]